MRKYKLQKGWQMMADKAKVIAYKNSFNAEKYDRVGLMLKKGCKETLQSIASASGESLNGYIKAAIKDRYKKDSGEEIEL